MKPFTRYIFFYASTAIRMKKAEPEKGKYDEVTKKIGKELQKLTEKYGELTVDSALISLIVSRVKELPENVRAMLIVDTIQNLAKENEDIAQLGTMKIPKPDDKEVT